MKRLAAILLLAGCTSASVPQRVDIAADIWSGYADEVDDAEVSVALVKDGVPAFAGDPRAIYRIGSLTEFFVLESARKLADRGEIDLDRPLTAFNRFAIDPLYARLSLRELGGLKPLPEGADDPPAFLTERFPWASDERLALFAALLENAVGKTLEEIVRDEIVLPLQLRDTSFTPSADKLPRIATRGEALGGLYSSAEDCVKFFASSDVVRKSSRLRRHEFDGVKVDFTVSRCLGCRRFLACPEDGPDFLLIFRNVLSLPQYRDFEAAAKAFSK